MAPSPTSSAPSFNSSSWNACYHRAEARSAEEFAQRERFAAMAARIESATDSGRLQPKPDVLESSGSRRGPGYRSRARHFEIAALKVHQEPGLGGGTPLVIDPNQ